MPAAEFSAEKFLALCPVLEDEEFEVAEVDPIHDPYWKRGPNPGQEAFHTSPARYRVVFGGLGSGKSTAIAREAFFHAVIRLGWIKHVGLVVSETYRHLADNTIPAFQRAFPPECLKGGSWDKAFRRSSMTLELATGSTIAFRVTGNRRYEMLRGPEYAWACFDEGRNIPTEEPWKVIIGRLRYPGVPPAMLRAWGGSTPNGHDWQWSTWVDKPTTDYAWIHAPTEGNRENLPDGYIETVRRSYSLEDAQQELEGLFVTRAGAVYKAIREEIWPKGNLFPLELDLRAPTWLEVDFGYRNPRMHAVQQIPVVHPETGVREVIDVIVWEWQEADGGPPRDRAIGELIDAAKGLGARDLRGIYCDPAGDSANDQNHSTSVAQLREAVTPNVQMPQATWQRSIANGEQVLRGLICAADGTRRLAWACPKEPDRLGKFRPRAPNSLRAMQGLQFAQRRPGTAEAEVSLKDGVTDHDCDAIRYRAILVHGRKPMAGSAISGFIQGAAA